MKGKIQMVDLQSQYLRLKDEFDHRIQSVLSDATFIQGPSVKAFEEELASYLRVKHVIAVGNGTDALQIAFMALGLNPGDEVIIPAFAYAALPEVLILLKLVPVFVDVRSDDFCIDPSQIEEKISYKTKAIAPVHLFGTVANMALINQLAKKYKLFVVEDAAQSIGAQYCSDELFGSAGCIGDIGTTSFFPSKNLGCYGDGGAIFTNDDGLAARIRKISNHGQSEKYYHDIIGVNSRLDTIQAEILQVKLPHLTEYNLSRKQIALRYISELSCIQEIELPRISSDSTHVFHQFTIRLIANVGTTSIEKSSPRDKFINYLTSKGIPSMVYYPLPLHQQKAYFTNIQLPVSEALCNQVVSLPICPELTPEYQKYIIDSIKEYFRKN
jgi:dTDP-4-amino-4,6-dideoxygalactose transaminase